MLMAWRSRASAGWRGFTLVELLVSLVIIALLVGILMPVISGARARAKSTACKANLRGIGQAVRMYLNENKEKYPLAPALPSVNPNSYPTLMVLLRKYVGSRKEVFECPSDGELSATEGTSYFYNSQLGTDPLEQNVFFQVFKGKQYVPIALDAGNFHGTARPFNCLFLDGRVEQVAKPAGVP